MPPSQLKRLKASLREQGVIGPQKSKKQKKQLAQNGIDNEKRIQRSVALNGIREQFNPFEVKTSARGPKFEVTSNKTLTGRISKGIRGRPGVSKGLGEENRRKTLLVEMKRRNKVGGIIDNRFGENDPTMAPEDKMMERFTQEKIRRHKNSSAFDLEDDNSADELTHMGKSLSLNEPVIDDFDEEGLQLSDAEDHPSDDERQRRKRRLSDEDASEGSENDRSDIPERKKSKQEVMAEVIAKSKLHKYERQQVKDDDEDLREELDKELTSIHELLRGVTHKPKSLPEPTIPGMNPDRAALLNGTDKIKFDKEYDMRLKQLAQDQRSKPTERSKTTEEKIDENAQKLRDLETQRLRRMQGLPQSEDEDAPEDDPMSEADGDDFGLGSGIKARPTMAELGIDDEDDFLLDDDLVASDSEMDSSESSSSNEDDDGSENESDEDDEFTKGLLTWEEEGRPEFLTGANAPLPEMELPANNGVDGDLPFTFECPQTLSDIHQMLKRIKILDLPLAVQRIRALYHPKLNNENKAKLGNFAVALVEYLAEPEKGSNPVPYSVLETLIRHVHSMAKMFPVEISNAFRKHLEAICQRVKLPLTPGDLVVFTAIGSIFPTSDHFHQVVTPAILCMARYIGQMIPQSLSDYAIGLFISTLCLKYQGLAKRYIPEVINFVENTICALAPTKMAKMPGSFPYHEPKFNTRIHDSSVPSQKLSIHDCKFKALSTGEESQLQVALLETSLRILSAASDTWISKSAFIEVFSPVCVITRHLSTQACRDQLPASTQRAVEKLHSKLTRQLSLAHLSRRPLELHHHRPLAIKTSIPKFEDSYNPDRHYDPDRERADAAKLRAEHKKERKGAMRELRKDANFIARESLREKKEKDLAYEKKYKRLVAEIQGEEGREAKAYEREKEWRKKGKK